jgi:hypothetical protein
MPDAGWSEFGNLAGPPQFDDTSLPTNAINNAFAVRGTSKAPGHSARPIDITNSMMPHGLQPKFGRTPLTPLTPDPLDWMSFKPPKQTVYHVDLHGTPGNYHNVYGTKVQTEQMYDHIAKGHTKSDTLRGAGNDMWPGQATSEYGFAQGEKMTLRTGGEHPRARYFRPLECTKPQLYFDNWRVVDNSKIATYAPTLGIRLPENADVKEYHRPPMPQTVLSVNSARPDPIPVIRWTNRQRADDIPKYHQPDEIDLFGGNGWAAPAGAVGPSTETLRTQYRDVIPQKSVMFSPAAFNIAFGHESKAGGQGVNKVQVRPTHRQNTMRANFQSPFANIGMSAARGTDYVPIVPVKVNTEGVGVSRPAGPSYGMNSVADSDQHHRMNHVVLMPTLRDEVIHDYALRPPVTDRPSLAPQYTIFGVSEDRKVSPLVENVIDPTMISPWKNNPYTPKIIF